MRSKIHKSRKEKCRACSKELRGKRAIQLTKLEAVARVVVRVVWEETVVRYQLFKLPYFIESKVSLNV